MLPRRFLARITAALTGAAALVLCAASTALAQVSIDPTVTPELNTGGWVYQMAILMAVIGALILIALVAGYLRFSPRFQREETGVLPRAEPVGRGTPRRLVDVSHVEPVVVAPPVVPAPGPAVAPAAAVAAAPPAPAAAPPAAVPAAAPSGPPPAEAAPPAAQPAAAPAETPTPAAAAPAQAASTKAPAQPRERHEVSLDQETFEKVLAELLEKGTNRRVAEGQARRAAMIAARKKAGA